MLTWIGKHIQAAQAKNDLKKGAQFANVCKKMTHEDKEGLANTVAAVAVAIQRDMGIDLMNVAIAIRGNPLLNQMLRSMADEFHAAKRVEMWAAIMVWYYTVRSLQVPEISLITEVLWNTIESTNRLQRPTGI